MWAPPAGAWVRARAGAWSGVRAGASKDTATHACWRCLWSVLAVLAAALGLLTAGVSALEVITPKEIHVPHGTEGVLSCKFKSKITTGPATTVSWSFLSGESNITVSFFHIEGGEVFLGDFPLFKKRVIWAGDLRKKDASIKIQNVQYNHNGTYICDVKNPPDIVSEPGYIHLYVEKKEVPTPPPTPWPRTPWPRTPLPRPPPPRPSPPRTPLPWPQPPGTPLPQSPPPGTALPRPPTPGTPLPQSPQHGTPVPQPLPPGTPVPRTPGPGTPLSQSPQPGTPEPQPLPPGTPVPRPPLPGTPLPRPPPRGTALPGPLPLGTPVWQKVGTAAIVILGLVLLLLFIILVLWYKKKPSYPDNTGAQSYMHSETTPADITVTR